MCGGQGFNDQGALFQQSVMSHYKGDSLHSGQEWGLNQPGFLNSPSLSVYADGLMGENGFPDVRNAREMEAGGTR